MDVIVLENAYLRMEICNPHNKQDKHLHTRFSHCGYISKLIAKDTGENLLSSPKEVFESFSGEGYPDEFEIPLGYDVAKPGECFVKIGVGLEQKLSDKPYTNWDEHPIVQLAETSVGVNNESVTFSQKLSFGACSYMYAKTIALDNKGFTIAHSLKNDGAASWKTLWYPHAYIPRPKGDKTIAVQMDEGCQIKTPSPYLLQNGNVARIQVDGQTSSGTCLQWEGTKTEGNTQFLRREDGVQILSYCGDYEAQEVQIYINDRIISIEPKLIFELTPGERKEWSVRHMF